MRRKKYTKTDCQRRISHALEKYLLRIREEQVKKKREVKGRCELWGRGTIENFEANANAVRKKNSSVIGTNEYVQRIFIRIKDLFMRAIFERSSISFKRSKKAFSFGIFYFVANLNKRQEFYNLNNLTRNLILLYDYYISPRKV